MGRQYFPDVTNDPPLASLTAITATVETGLWSVPLFTPVAANDPRAGKIYKVFAGGVLSTAASGALTITPRWGTTTGGNSLGPSLAQTVPINLAGVSWTLEFTLIVRSVGIAASGSTVVGEGHFHAPGAVATAGSSFDLTFGGTVVTTADTTTAQGIFIGWTLSVAGSVTPHWAYIQPQN